MGRIDPENPEFQKYIQSESEAKNPAPKLALKFRQDLAALNDFGVRFKQETVKHALWSYIREIGAGYEKKYKNEIQLDPNRTLIVKGDIAFAISTRITGYLDNDEFFKAGKKNSDEGEELQLQMIAQAIKNFIDNEIQDIESSDLSDEDREQKEKTIKLISKLIE